MYDLTITTYTHVQVRWILKVLEETGMGNLDKTNVSRIEQQVSKV